MEFSDFNPVSEPTRLVSNNEVFQIKLAGVHNTVVESNEYLHGSATAGYCIWLEEGTYNVIRNNEVTEGDEPFYGDLPNVGIFIGPRRDYSGMTEEAAMYNEVCDNWIQGFSVGIGVTGANNSIHDNIVEGGTGIRMGHPGVQRHPNPRANRIYNNSFETECGGICWGQN